MNDSETVCYLLDSCSWQENLLQTYRSFHITIQSILLAIGVGLTVTVYSIESFPSHAKPVLIFSFLLTAVFILQLFIKSRMKGIIIARGKDINWWHKQIILEENRITPHKRYFTKFKIHQQARRKDINHLEEIFLVSSKIKLEEDQVELLIGKGLGHTRKVIDNQLFRWIGLVWWLLLLATCINPIVSYFF
jgi:hypothetical protein